jgi:hypothetical protein
MILELSQWRSPKYPSYISQFRWNIDIGITQILFKKLTPSPKAYLFHFFPLFIYMDMKRHMSMISSKIKFEIDINNDELLEPNGNIFKKKKG